MDGDGSITIGIEGGKPFVRTEVEELRAVIERLRAALELRASRVQSDFHWL